MKAQEILRYRAQALVRRMGGEVDDYLQESELRILELSAFVPVVSREAYRRWIICRAPSRYLFLPRTYSNNTPQCEWSDRQYVADASLPLWVLGYLRLTIQGGLSAELDNCGRVVSRNKSLSECALVDAILENENVFSFVSSF